MVSDSSHLQARFQSVKRWGWNLLTELYREWAPYQPSAERRPAPGYIVYRPTDSGPISESIKNISSTGLYLCTEERWLPGAVVSLTLQRNGPFEENPEHRVTLKARVVRWGDDGVGMAFAMPGELNFNLWRSAIENAEDRRGADDILEPFRMAEALTFLTRICPYAAQELRDLVLKGLSNARARSAVEIALEAELFLGSERGADLMRADPQVILRIIQDGSWVDEDWIRHLWAGLLTTYCAVGKIINTDVEPVVTFSQLAPVHVILLKAACVRAIKMFSDTGVSAEPADFTMEEIQWMTGIQSTAKLERDIHHLATVGLIESSTRTQSMMAAREARLTPSPLGLTLYARCHGHRGQVEDFYRGQPSLSLLRTPE